MKVWDRIIHTCCLTFLSSFLTRSEIAAETVLFQEQAFEEALRDLFGIPDAPLDSADLNALTTLDLSSSKRST
ncbi:MAG: hypothetical protein QGG73_04540 [Candidatus Hydrogenedentes bacterium]|jgi:hypothetical protein|nr:hypothetical protein [Candidatus Hydrogenedentota bacterium]|tara:strand:+ start:260 stop:478 length:219 start_codon:yes stop_codon:yes gene_type:complete